MNGDVSPRVLHVIADVDAGIGDRIPDVERALKERGLEFDLEIANRREDVEAATRRSLRAGIRSHVIVGDDGSINGFVNGVFEDGRPVGDEPPVLGVVAAGAECDFARSFGLPGEVEPACDHLLGGDEYEIDLMKVAATTDDGRQVHRFAATLCQIGFGAAAAAAAARVPARMGRARRFAGYWVALARARPRRVDVLADTKAFAGPSFDIVVGNTQYGMGGLRLSPRSFPGDGVLDVVVWRGPRSDAVRLLPSLFRLGDHLPHPHITEMRAKIRVAVESERPLAVAVDGVALGSTPVSVQIVPRAIRLQL